MSSSDEDLLHFFGKKRPRSDTLLSDELKSKQTKDATQKEATRDILFVHVQEAKQEQEELALPTWADWKAKRMMHEPLLQLFSRNEEWVNFLGEEAVETCLRVTSTKLTRCMTRTSGKEVFPPFPQVFRAYELCKPEDVRVAIIGQDPYPTKGNAHGLAFSKMGPGIPASLKNIFAEIQTSTGVEPKMDANLERWARQGVFMINADLTVPENSAGKHKGAWASFTGETLKKLGERDEGVAFVAWGSPAQKTLEQNVGVVGSHHLYLKCPHPSPLSARTGFFGCNHFAQINEWLVSSGREAIDWS